MKLEKCKEKWKTKYFQHTKLLRSQSTYSYFASLDNENNLLGNYREPICFTCRNIVKSEMKTSCEHCNANNNLILPVKFDKMHSMTSDIKASTYLPFESRKPHRNKQIDVFTSFTDSPLFSRKYRLGGHQHNDGGSIPETVCSKAENNGFNLVKHIAEARWKQKDTKNICLGPKETDSRSDNNVYSAKHFHRSRTKKQAEKAVEATSIETRSFVSLHTQVSSNIFAISFLN